MHIQSPVIVAFMRNDAMMRPQVVFMCAITLVISTVELFALGVYTRTRAMTVLGLLLFGTCLITLLTVYFGVHSHHMEKVDGQITGKKKSWSRLFLIMGFVNVPCSGAMSLLCFTLGGEENMNVPWVSDFIGTQTGLSQNALLSDAHNASGTLLGSNATGLAEQYRNETAGQLTRNGLSSDDISRQEAVSDKQATQQAQSAA